MDTSPTQSNLDPWRRLWRIYVALQLDRTVARDPGVEVLLIDPQNFLVFTPMLHEVASGSLWTRARSSYRSARPCGV